MLQDIGRTDHYLQLSRLLPLSIATGLLTSTGATTSKQIIKHV
jgi:hypothetical protein